MADLTVMDKPASRSVLFIRAIFEMILDNATCQGGPTHDECVKFKGARWPEPLPGHDLEQPLWLP